MVGLGDVRREKLVIVRIANYGSKRTTLTTLALVLYPSRWAFVRRKAEKQFAVLTLGGPGWQNLPFEIGPGEQWGGMFRQDQEVEAMARSGLLYCHVYHSSSSKPVSARVVIPARTD